ncbi:MAG: hypothetical protein RR313_10935 [Anaerovoracaceae bacterium]
MMKIVMEEKIERLFKNEVIAEIVDSAKYTAVTIEGQVDEIEITLTNDFKVYAEYYSSIEDTTEKVKLGSVMDFTDY